MRRSASSTLNGHRSKAHQRLYRPAKTKRLSLVTYNRFCEGGEIVEFQIRTKEMHAMNEYGIAATGPMMKMAK
jgi:hypothetical protein